MTADPVVTEEPVLSAGEQTPVDSPADLTRADYLAAFKRTFKEIKRDDLPGLSAGVAFRIFLSIFPSLIAAVGVWSLVTDPSELGELIGRLQGVLPEEALGVIRDQLQRLSRSRGGLVAVLFGVGVGLYAATTAATSLMKALSRAYNVPENRKFLKQRLVALALILALLTALTTIAALLVFGPQLQDALLPDFVTPVDILLGLVRGVLALCVLVVLFAFVYWIGPARAQPTWQWMSPGAVLGVLGWLAAALGFTIYAQTAGSYSETYGALAGVVVLMLWLQISMLVLLVGAEFNAEIERTKEIYEAVDQGAGFAMPAPTAAPAIPDQESGGATRREGRAEAATIATVDVEEAATPNADFAPPAAPPPPPEQASTRAGDSDEADDAAGQAAPGDAPAGAPLANARRGAARNRRRARSAGRDGPESLGPARKRLAALTAAGMAVAIFLGFARRGGDN